MHKPTDPPPADGDAPGQKRTVAHAPSVGATGDETAASRRGPPQSGVAFGPPAAPGEVGTLGPYRVVKQLGAGGMGAVFRAFDTRLNRKLALKVMLPEFAANEEAKARFLREARAAAQVEHDNVVTVYAADEHDGVPYIAMQLLQGYPLDEYLKKKHKLTVPQILRLARETAAGLAAAHKLGLVHRDIKPANLWLEAPHGRVKVLDFGLARPVAASSELTQSGAVVGTPAYMSPEQGRGQKVDHRSDLFSLGAVLYRLATGRPPFGGATVMAVLMALGTEEPTPVRELNPTAPEPLAELIHQLLAKSPDDRPQTADEVGKRIRAIVEGTVLPRGAAGPVPVAPNAAQVVYVPIQVTAQSENSVFAQLDTIEDETRPLATTRPPAPRRPPGGKGMLVAAGVATLLAAVAVAGVVIVIKNKDGTETKIEVPDGATVTVKGHDGKTIARVPPSGKPPAVQGDPDRAAAKYVLSIGGRIQLAGDPNEIRDEAKLPVRDRVDLRMIWLRGNTQVTDEGLAPCEHLKELSHLDLVSTPVTDKGIAHFKNCKYLTILDLAGTPITDEGIAHFEGSTSIVSLWLGGTKVGNGVSVFAECKRLNQLSLHNTAVTDEGLAAFKECKSIFYLYLADTKVTDAGIATFKDCKNLSTLALQSTGVTDAGLIPFLEGKKLTDVNLTDTKVTQTTIDALQKAYPRCTIRWNGGTIEPTKK